MLRRCTCASAAHGRGGPDPYGPGGGHDYYSQYQGGGGPDPRAYRNPDPHGPGGGHDYYSQYQGRAYHGEPEDDFARNHPRFGASARAGDGEWQRRVRDAEEENARIRGELHGLRRKHKAANPQVSAVEQWEAAGEGDVWRRRFEVAANDPWAALDVPKTASFATIKTKYKTLVKQLHPDMPTGDPERFKKVSAGYKALQQRQKELAKYGMTEDGGQGDAPEAKEEEDDEPFKYEHEPSKRFAHVRKKYSREMHEHRMKEVFGEHVDIQRRVKLLSALFWLCVCAFCISVAYPLYRADWRHKRPQRLRHENPPGSASSA